MILSTASQKHRVGIVVAAAAATLAATFALNCAMPAQAQAADREYGQLCAKFESNDKPAYIESGVAYGAYQMDAKDAHKYVKWLKAGANKKKGSSARKYSISMGKSLVKAYKKDGNKCGTNFNTAWRNAAKVHSITFYNTQYSYCKTYFYEKAVTYIKKYAKGFHPTSYSIAFRNVLFSTAVEHGAKDTANVIFKKAVKKAGGWEKGMGEDVLITNIYKERSRKTSTSPAIGAVQVTNGNLRSAALTAKAKKCGLLNKYTVYFYNFTAAAQLTEYQRLHTDEPAAAFKMMIKYGGHCTHTYTSGGKKIYKKSKSNDVTHYFYKTKVTCDSCGAILSDATTYKTAKHVFKYKKAKYKCACGMECTNHVAHKYYRTSKGAVNVRSKASTSSSLVTTAGAGRTLYVKSCKKGSDKCWWGKVTVNGRTGYVRMNLLTIHGNGSTGNHYFVGNKCKYCKCTRTQCSYTTKGTYKVKSKTYYYKAAFTKSTKSSVLAKGKKVTITKVVRNTYNQLWGVTKSGKYIDMSKLKK